MYHVSKCIFEARQGGKAKKIDALDGNDTSAEEPKKEESGGILHWFGGIWKSAKGVLSFSDCKQGKKEKGSELSVVRTQLMNENHDLLEFIKEEGLFEKYHTNCGSRITGGAEEENN